MYKKVVITDVFKRGLIVECSTEDEFKKYINDNDFWCNL